jgi:hypothetical protein
MIIAKITNLHNGNIRQEELKKPEDAQAYLDKMQAGGFVKENKTIEHPERVIHQGNY